MFTGTNWLRSTTTGQAMDEVKISQSSRWRPLIVAGRGTDFLNQWGQATPIEMERDLHFSEQSRGIALKLIKAPPPSAKETVVHHHNGHSVHLAEELSTKRHAGACQVVQSNDRTKIWQDLAWHSFGSEFLPCWG